MEKDSYLKRCALSASDVLEAMAKHEAYLNLILLDACRNQPSRMMRSARNAPAGFSEMKAPAGSVLAFACAPGKTAADGTGRNGVFTSNLLRHLTKPGLDVDKMLRAVAKGVFEDTRKQQDPFHNHNLREETVCLVDAAPEAAPPAPSPPRASSDGDLAAFLARCDLEDDATEVLAALQTLGVKKEKDLALVTEADMKQMPLPVIAARRLREGLEGISGGRLNKAAAAKAAADAKALGDAAARDKAAAEKAAADKKAAADAKAVAERESAQKADAAEKAAAAKTATEAAGAENRSREEAVRRSKAEAEAARLVAKAEKERKAAAEKAAAEAKVAERKAAAANPEHSPAELLTLREDAGPPLKTSTPLSVAAAARSTPFVTVQGKPLLNAELCAGADLRSSLGDEPLCYFQWCAPPQRRRLCVLALGIALASTLALCAHIPAPRGADSRPAVRAGTPCLPSMCPKSVPRCARRGGVWTRPRFRR